MLWGWLRWDDRYPEVTVPGSGCWSRPGIYVHRSSILTPQCVTRHKGIPVTSPARTLIDMAPRLEWRPLRRLVREAQAQHRVNVRQLADALARFRGRSGTPAVARIIATGPAPTRSELEDVVLDLILRGGFAHPDVNVPLLLGGRRVVPDFRWPAQRLVIEADGAAWHDNPLVRADDAERQALLEASGERVIRVIWEQAITRAPQTHARILAAGAPLA